MQSSLLFSLGRGGIRTHDLILKDRSLILPTCIDKSITSD
nr:MAG TPA: hypothetical protein [Caudoviricetes sp.]